MKRSNYRIILTDNSNSQEHNINIHTSKEFVEFTRTQFFYREDFEVMALNIMLSFGYKVERKYFERDGGICEWEGNSGLLKKVHVVGNNSFIELDEKRGVYESQNITRVEQVASILGIMTRYFNYIEDKIPQKSTE